MFVTSMKDERQIEMDTPTGRVRVPGATGRLHGADRSGLGQEGWAETPEDGVGHPAEGNVPAEYYEPLDIEKANR